MFDAGKYIVILQFDKDLSKGSMHFVNYEIDLESNFDLFADTMIPKSVAGFHKLQERIKGKDITSLSPVLLTDMSFLY